MKLKKIVATPRAHDRWRMVPAETLRTGRRARQLGCQCGVFVYPGSRRTPFSPAQVPECKKSEKIFAGKFHQPWHHPAAAVVYSSSRGGVNECLEGGPNLCARLRHCRSLLAETLHCNVCSRIDVPASPMRL